MKKTRKRKVTIETERRVVVSHPRGGVVARCEACGATPMVGVVEAAAVAKMKGGSAPVLSCTA